MQEMCQIDVYTPEAMNTLTSSKFVFTYGLIFMTYQKLLFQYLFKLIS